MSINKAQGQTVRGRIGVWLPTPVFAHGQLYVACSRATQASNVRVLVEDYEDKQRKLACGAAGSDEAAVYTLNLVDRTLLCDGSPGVPPQATSPQCCVEGADPQKAAGGGVAAGLEEQHRLDTVTPDALASSSDGPLHWHCSPCFPIPFAADEWAHVEAGASQPCVAAGSGTQENEEEVLLDQVAPDIVEYVSEDEVSCSSFQVEFGLLACNLGGNCHGQ